MENLKAIDKSYEIYNLGSGCGYSVLEVLKGFEVVLGKPVTF
jgi:UDP-glucose 4-epimerase